MFYVISMVLLVNMCIMRYIYVYIIYIYIAGYVRFVIFNHIILRCVILLFFVEIVKILC